MKKIPLRSIIGLGFIFLFSLNVILVVAGLITDITGFIVVAIILSVIQIILRNLFARKQSTLRNYPFNEKLKYVLGKISPLLSRTMIKRELLRKNVSPKQYKLIVSRANNMPTDVVSRALSFSDNVEFEGLKLPSHTSIDLKISDLRVQIGSAQCAQPYNSSIINVDGLTQKALTNTTILALSEGANIQSAAVNTGNGSISPYLIRGGSDLIWQIAHEDYAFRKDDGSFNEKLFQVTATRPYIKMIEIVLPRHETSIMKRLVGHRMISFLGRLRDLSEGKPIGIRLFNPSQGLINCICNSMYATKIDLDFITIDDKFSVGGFDSHGLNCTSRDRYFESLSGARKAINGYGLVTKIIASSIMVSEYDILRSIALGANACYFTVPMVLAASFKSRFKIKNPITQRIRVADFHRKTIDATITLMELCGYNSLEDVKPDDFYRKMTLSEMKSFREIYFQNRPVKNAQVFEGLP